MSELPPVLVPHPHVEVRDDLMSGSPVIRGSKVPVRRLWAWHRKGVTAETLVKRYPALGPAKVLGALAFGYDNEALVDADLAREQRLLDQENLENGRNEREPQQTRLRFQEKRPGGG